MSGGKEEKREGRRRGTYLFSEVHESIHCLSLTWPVCGLDTLRVILRKEREQLIDDAMTTNLKASLSLSSQLAIIHLLALSDCAIMNLNKLSITALE